MMNPLEKIETLKAAEALRVSEVRYRRLFETAKDGILILNDETGMVLDVNPFLEELLGFSHDSFLGKEVWELGFFKDIFANHEKFLELQKKGYVRYDNLPLETTDGRKIAVEFVSNVYQENGHKVIQCNIRDITERKRTEKSLGESEERFRTAAENLTDVVYDWDIKEKIDWYGDIDGIMGYPPGGFPRTIKAWVETLHPEDKDRVMAALDGQLKGVAPFVIEYRVRRRDGEWRWWSARGAALRNERGEPYKMVGSISDITERKQAEEALRASEEEFRSLAESMPQIVWVTRPDGSNIYFNQQWMDYTGLTPEESHGHGWNTPFHPDDRLRAWKAWQDAIQNNAAYSLECRLRRADGAYRWWLVRGVPLRNKNGEILKWFGTCTDIEDIKQAEENLRKVNEELQTALQELRRSQKQMVREERLSALGQMASGIAHDFNNVLVPIAGYSEMLLAKPEILSNRDEALSMIADINTAAEDARRIVQRLGLIRGSEDEGNHVPVDINEIVKGAVELIRPRWDKEMGAKGNTIKIVTRLKADKQTPGDASQLREAMINLILNAVDAMPKGGTLTISTRRKKENVVVEVVDEGTGMTDETKERCLEPFFTTKGAKGTGLGLSMVLGIVTRHNGTMEIDSILKKGTTIRLILPCTCAEHVAKESKADKTGKEFIVAPLWILVADDDEYSRILVQKLLTKDGHSVEIARTGLEAIDKAKEGNFDLVITDRSMPDANGDLVALSVKTRTPETPVILLTGFGDIMNEKGECPPGVDRVLSKPLTQRDLREAIAKVMGPPSPGAAV